MWRRIWNAFSAISGVAGCVGWITIPDDAVLWPDRVSPYLPPMTKDTLIIILFGMSALGFFTS